MLNGHDPEAFIWSSNVKRRQMLKGQIAMVAAMGFSADPNHSGGAIYFPTTKRL
jgi:hypothetical protein